MQDAETPEGQRLSDLLVEYSKDLGKSPHNLRNLYDWVGKLKALHHLLSYYHDAEYLQEYEAIMKRIREASKTYPSAKYVEGGYDVIFDWLDAISRLFSRLGMMIPQKLTYTEGSGDDGI